MNIDNIHNDNNNIIMIVNFCLNLTTCIQSFEVLTISYNDYHKLAYVHMYQLLLLEAILVSVIASYTILHIYYYCKSKCL